MPTDVVKLGIYTLRIIMPPNHRTFAVETPIAVRSVEQDLFSNYNIDFIQFDIDDSDEVVEAGATFNGRGFMFVTNSGPGKIADMPDEFDIGYILGLRPTIDMTLVTGIVIPDDLSSVTNAPTHVFV